MKSIQQIVNGEFTPRSLRVYLAGVALVFWGLIFQCWLIFPEAHDFSILSHTFSYLGSFDPRRNPEGWWLFTLAMGFWGLASVPLARYSGRQLATVSPRAARRGRRFLILGCIGIVIVALFPDAGVPLLGGMKLSDLHNLGALAVSIGFVVGASSFAAIIFRVPCVKFPGHDPDCTCLKRARWPHVFFLSVTAIALGFLLRWEILYPRLRAAAEASGAEFGSKWQEGLHTIYAFPLWDNVFVFTLFVYLWWNALVLPSQDAA